MSSDPPSDGPSAGPEPDAAEAPAGDEPLAELLRSRGAPLLEALASHSPDAREHADGTASFSFAVAVELGCERDACEATREAARLHEVGLVYVPAEVLAKDPADRDEAEASLVAAHHEAGYRLARGAGIPERACGWLLRARERHDGSGPERLRAEAIPLESRIIRAACACETALSTPPAPGARGGARAATAELRRLAGPELEPRVAFALIAVLERAAS